MATTITNLRTLHGLGIWADRSAKSPDLAFRRYNLIYGFNGSGKSTLSRLFASLNAGILSARLPEGCAFEVAMDDGNTFGCPSKPSGLARRVIVFNSDYVEENLQWAAGLVNPVFFIGADQADAAAELGRLESKIAAQSARFEGARATVQLAERNFTNFKRDRAKITAAHLFLGSRKYEAPSLAKDYETWPRDEARALTQVEFEAARDARQKAEPMPKLDLLVFDPEGVAIAFAFVSEICCQSLTSVALDEVQRFPEMLMWVKEGHAFHATHAVETCLMCGSVIKKERMELLASALDARIDQFITKLSKTASRLDAVWSSLGVLEEAAPSRDSVGPALRHAYMGTRGDLVGASRRARKYLADLQNVLFEKQKQPASPADMSQLPTTAEVAATVKILAQALASANDILAKHNQAVMDFTALKDAAEL